MPILEFSKATAVKEGATIALNDDGSVFLYSFKDSGGHRSKYVEDADESSNVKKTRIVGTKSGDCVNKNQWPKWKFDPENLRLGMKTKGVSLDYQKEKNKLVVEIPEI